MECFNGYTRVLLIALPLAIFCANAAGSFLIKRRITRFPIALFWFVALTLFSQIVWLLPATLFSIDLFYCQLGREKKGLDTLDEVLLKIGLGNGWLVVGMILISGLIMTLVKPYSKLIKSGSGEHEHSY